MGNNIIEFNGKRYDALKGTYLGDAPKGSSPAVLRHVTHQGRAVDGFMPGVKKASQTVTAVHKNSAAPVKVAKKIVASRSGVPMSAHKPQHAKTLMRHIVSKPDISMKPVVKAQAPAEMKAAPIAVLAPKLSATHVNPHRLMRAKSAGQSQHIKRFANTPQHHTESVRPQPMHDGTVQRMPRDVVAQKAVSARRVDAVAATHAHIPVKKAPQEQTPEHHDLFEAAIANARSHEQPKVKAERRHRRLINVTAITAAFLILGGFVGYLNMPNIEVHVASIQAGFHAQLPAYKPTGYALAGSVHANNGVVTVGFSSGDSSFQLQQQASNWDSQTLYQSVVAMAGTASKTYQSQGRQVYVYGNNAAWVNAGVLYNLKTTGNLTPNEMVSVATSI